MGFKQVGFGLVFILAVGLCDVKWQGRSTHNQSPVMFKPRALMPPLRAEFGQSSLDPMGVQSKQLLQGPVAKLTWSFPRLPEEPEQPDIPFELRQPVPANSIAAQCGENMVYIEVMEDFFGTGQPLTASAFTLGGCSAVAEDTASQVLIFESELHACDSMLTVTEDELVYTFSLVYNPEEALSGPIVRSSGVVVGIECHYPRMHNVSSNTLMPTWMPYASTRVAEELLVFSLKLMTDDWRFERPSNQYFLGDVINIEASVISYNHVPFRVFADSCVATVAPDINSVPRYSFIENNGCMVDAKITGSNSYFMPRIQGEKLQLQLDAFRFQQDDSGLVYITCFLKVAAASAPTNAEQKACSFSANGWVSADETDQVCGCCDTSCGIRIGSDQLLQDLRWERASVGPIRVKEFPFGHM